MNDVVEGKKDRSVRTSTRGVIRFFKALFKAAIVYIFFFIFSMFMIPFEGFQNYQMLSTALVVLYILFIFVIELAHDTIFQHIFAIANSLIMLLYFAHILDMGIINVAVEQIAITIDLRFFLTILALGGLLSLAKSMFQLLNWMNKREERWLRCQIKSL